MGPRGRGCAQGGRARPPPSWLGACPSRCVLSARYSQIFQKKSYLNFRAFGELLFSGYFYIARIIQKIQNVLEKSAPFLPGVLAQSRNDELFVKGILGSLKIILVDPSCFQGVLGVLSSPFQVSVKVDMMQHSNA